MNSVIIHTLRKRSLFKISNNEAKVQGRNQSQGQGQNQISKSKSAETQIYLILLLVAFSFFILITPLYAFNLYVQFVDFAKSPKAFAEFYIFFQIMHKMYFTNNAINFFLYVISGQKFRNDLINLFKWSNGVSRETSLSNLSVNNTKISAMDVPSANPD